MNEKRNPVAWAVQVPFDTNGNPLIRKLHDHTVDCVIVSLDTWHDICDRSPEFKAIEWELRLQ